ncbi:MAG: sensor histidine kinase [Thermoplasmatota archaeon]
MATANVEARLRRWSEPAPGVIGKVDRRRARSAIILLSVLVPLGVASFLASLFIAGGFKPFDSGSIGAVVGLALLGACIPIARTNSYRVAINASILITALTIRAVWYAIAPFDGILYFLALPIFMGGLLAGSRGAALASGLSLAIGVVSILQGRVEYPTAVASFLIIIGAVDVLLTLQTERDAEEIERATEAERVSRAAARAQEEMRVQTIANVAHDLASPLTPIKIQLSLLSTDAPPKSSSLRILNANALQLERLINDLKDLSQLEMGKLRLNRERVNVRTLLQTAADSFRPLAEAKGVALSLVMEPHDLQVVGDEGRLEQVVYNFTTNALKFTPTGGRITLNAGIVSSDQMIEVRVNDTGSGLAPEQIAQLFKPFSQVHDASDKTKTGSGLGLFISKGIVEAHGGHVSVESDGPGHGSTFILRLPVAPDAPSVPPLSTQRADAGPAGDWRPRPAGIPSPNASADSNPQVP